MLSTPRSVLPYLLGVFLIFGGASLAKAEGDGPKPTTAAKPAQKKSSAESGHEVVTNPGNGASSGAGTRTEADDNVDADDAVSSSGGESATELTGGDEAGAESAGELDAGEIELLGQMLQATAAEESADELADRFAELQSVLPDAERFSDAEYASFKALPSMEALQFGDVLESVCPPDNRIRITNTTQIPWRWNCQLIMTLASGNKATCTGWLIGPHTVMTAGHCVYSKANGGWVKSVEVIPGMNASVKPFGSFKSTKLFSVKGWTNSSDTNYDYGAMHINANIGTKLGWYGYASLGSSELKGLNVNLAGYPGDKPFGTQWYHWGPITEVLARKIKYYIDTYGGQSGSAVYRIKNGQRHAVAVHTNGGCPNAGTRITAPVATNMANWKK